VVVHPETGRQALLLGRRRNAYVLGLPLSDSDALLDALWAHATQPSLVFRQQWRVGDLLLWDNRATLHRRDAFDPTSRRRMHRTQIRGAVPVPAVAAQEMAA
jgi:taurine dioxygenase